MNPTVNHLREIAEHLDTFELAEPASVQTDRETCVQVHGLTLPTLAADLLAWADTITVDALQVWRPPDGRSVHVRLYGHLPTLTAVLIYGGVHSAGLFPDLQPGGRQSVSLTVLRCWAEDAEGRAAA